VTVDVEEVELRLHLLEDTVERYRLLLERVVDLVERQNGTRPCPRRRLRIIYPEDP
jgi:hypothetical protein